MIFSLLPGIVAGYFLFVGVFIWDKAKPHRARAALLALCATTFIWQMTWAILFQVTDPKLANILIKFGYLLIIFLPTTLYHFLIEIAAVHQERRYVYLSYGIAGVLAVILLLSDLFVTGYYEYYWGYYPKAGVVHPLHVLQTSVVVIRGLFIAYQKQKTSIDPLKSQLRYCIVSLLIYTFAALDYLCNYGIEFYPPGILFVTVSLTMMTYAMIKKELLDIQIVITRFVAHLITAILIILTFIIINMLPGYTESTTLLLNIVIALVWGKYGGRLREKLQTTSERKWVSDWYEPNEVVDTLTQRLHHILERKAIVLTVTETLIEVMGIKQTHALIRDQHDYRWYTNNLETEKAIVDSDHLIDWLVDHPARVITFAELPLKIKQDNDLRLSEASLILPIHSSQRLEGMIVLDERASELHYNQKDRKLLESIARQMDVFLDRAETHQILMAEAEALHKEKLILTKAIAGNIAHELRTPLTTISMTAKSFGKYLPDLWTGYDIGVQRAQACVEPASFVIPVHRRDNLKSGVENIGRAVRRAQTMITLLLANVRSDAIDEKTFHIYSMQACVEKALSDYPFQKDEKARVYFNNANNFYFEGSDILLIYVLYNLIKNALYYMTQIGKGEIRIWMKQSNVGNILYFKDTGAGIPESILPRIFDHFFTMKPKDVGNGLGLSFCQRVIKSFNGDIQCSSQHGKYTEFSIRLPCVGV